MTQHERRDMNQIAVIIPCYNEAATIGQVVREFAAALPEATIFVGDNILLTHHLIVSVAQHHP